MEHIEGVLTRKPKGTPVARAARDSTVTQERERARARARERERERERERDAGTQGKPGLNSDPKP